PDTVYSLCVYRINNIDYLVAAGGRQGQGFIMRWVNNDWLTFAVFGPPNDIIRTLQVYNGNLYAAGSFRQIGARGMDRIGFTSDGFIWNSLGSASNGCGDDIYALTVWNNKLIVGGD